MNANGPQNPAERARLGDYNRFLAELQREYWLRRREEVRSVGFKGVVLSTGWKAGGPGGQAPNLYADSALETIDRHGYWGGFGDVQPQDVLLPTIWGPYNKLISIKKRNTYDPQKAGEAMKLPTESTLGARLKKMQREKKERQNSHK